MPILAGTDAINPGTAHGASIHRELELLVAAGLSPSEALAAATSVPAAIFGLSGRGRIAPGVTGRSRPRRRRPDDRHQGDPADRRRLEAGPCDRPRRLPQGIADATRAWRPRPETTPAPAGSEKGLVSDFDGEKIQSAFGSGWSISTDSVVGGKSKASIQLVAGGAEGSKGALRISGTIEDRSAAALGRCPVLPRAPR